LSQLRATGAATRLNRTMNELILPELNCKALPVGTSQASAKKHSRGYEAEPRKFKRRVADESAARPFLKHIVASEVPRAELPWAFAEILAAFANPNREEWPAHGERKTEGPAERVARSSLGHDKAFLADHVARSELHPQLWRIHDSRSRDSRRRTRSTAERKARFPRKVGSKYSTLNDP